MVSSGIEPLIPALLARCLNQLGQETYFMALIMIHYLYKYTSRCHDRKYFAMEWMTLGSPMVKLSKSGFLCLQLLSVYSYN
ncbi:hypothetical protein ACU8KH_05169 [Lachancea thermotolerans]